MTAAAWLGLLAAWAAAIALPGPDVFLLLRLGIRRRRAAVLAALGIMTGNLVWILVSVLGLTAILAAVPGLLPALQLTGAAVLGWLGARSIHGGVAQLRSGGAAEPSQVSTRPWLLGLTTNLANPKALIFFTALLTQFLPNDAPWGTRIGITLVLVGSGIVWFVAVALASSAAAFRAWFGRAAPWIDIVAGAVFVLVALLMLAETLLALA
ncbi:LysE family translocator [Leucobacter allii]|uniref:LysE family translocator n=1 Tax=Leucobacter allii TaxID=2932247 RepID=A0ABY4FR96_9MICO|nr:LysE family translocator [Leucobacter allii]UOQ58811.1 LysE family translocator [Leucobacter allii]